MPQQLARYAANEHWQAQRDDSAHTSAAPPDLLLAIPATPMAQRASEQVQRAGEPEPAGSAAAPRPDAPGQPAAAQNDPRQVERLADQVYEHLRRRLRIDQERRGSSM
jgi:hypothetical protein